MNREETEHAKGFTQGVLYAVARIVQMFDEPTMAAEILRESGVNPRLADEYDRPFVNKVLRSLPGRKTVKR